GMRVRCHHGFGPGGVVSDLIPMERAFAGIVIEQGRTGYLEDIALRQELQIPQPVSGAKMVSVLATPLLVRGKPIGTLEVYSQQRRNWADDHVALIESLAAQTSVTLENSALFREVDESRRRLATILENVPVGLAIGDAALKNVRFNPAGASLMGMRP